MKEYISLDSYDYSQVFKECNRVEQISFEGSDIKDICANVTAYFSKDFSKIKNVVMNIVSKDTIMMTDVATINELCESFPEEAQFTWGCTLSNEEQQTPFRLDFQIGYIE